MTYDPEQDPLVQVLKLAKDVLAEHTRILEEHNAAINSLTFDRDLTFRKLLNVQDRLNNLEPGYDDTL